MFRIVTFCTEVHNYINDEKSKYHFTDQKYKLWQSMKSNKDSCGNERVSDWRVNCIYYFSVKKKEKEVLNPCLGQESDLIHAMTILYSPFILFLLSECIKRVVLYTILHKTLPKFKLLLMWLPWVWALKGWFLIPTFKFYILFPLFHLHPGKYLRNSSLLLPSVWASYRKIICNIHNPSSANQIWSQKQKLWTGNRKTCYYFLSNKVFYQQQQQQKTFFTVFHTFHIFHTKCAGESFFFTLTNKEEQERICS